MKKLLAALVLFAASYGATFAQSLPATLNMDQLNRLEPNSVGVTLPQEFAKEKAKAIDKLLASSFSKVETLPTAFFNFYNSATNPVIYEPKSKMLIAVFRKVVAHTGSTINDGTVYLRTSIDNGVTWSEEREIYRAHGIFPVYPSIAVLNPNGSNNVEDFNFMIYAPIYKMDQDSVNANIFGGLYLIKQGTDLQKVELEIPETNNPERARWFYNNTLAVDNASGSVAYAWGSLFPQTGKNWGYYGFSAFDMNSGNFISGIPTAWALNKFRQETDQSKGSYQNPLEVRADENGTLYAAAANIFAGNIGRRIPGVSKSTDNGATWSDWDIADSVKAQALASQVISQEGGVLGYWTILAYDGDAFEVTGPDEFSFFCRGVFAPSDADQYATRIPILEFSKKNGVWDVRMVGEVSNRLVFTMANESFAQNGAEKGDFINDDEMGNELESAMSENNDQVILKWVDYVDQVVAFEEPITFYRRNSATRDDLYDYQEMILDTMNTTDIFMTWRNAGDYNWAEPKNVSNDVRYDRISRMPPVVPNKDKVYLFLVDTDVNGPAFTNPNNPLYNTRNAYPTYMREMAVDVTQDVFVTSFPFEEGFQRVKSVVEYAPGFSVSAPYPNPVSDGIANIRFNLVNPGTATFRMTNSLGEIITEKTEFVGAGEHNVRVPVDMLSSGAYFYTVTVGDHTISQILNVVR